MLDLRLRMITPLMNLGFRMASPLVDLEFTLLDHEYSANARSQPPKSGSGGKIDDDPAGFLEKEFSAVEVSFIVNALGNGKAACHDFIINEALKEAPEAFIALLTKLFNMFKSRGRIPRSWSRGQVVLIHKKGPVSDINYL